MQSLVLSQSGIYHLQQLSTLVRKKTGVRHQLSDQRSIINLLRYSSTCPDALVYDSYSEFTDHLDDDQRIYLQGRGLLIPPKAFSLPNNVEKLRPIAQ